MTTKTNLQMYRDSKGRFTKRSREVEAPDIKPCDKEDCGICHADKISVDALEDLAIIAVEANMANDELEWENDDLRDDLSASRGRNALWFMLGLLAGITIASVAVIVGMSLR